MSLLVGRWIGTGAEPGSKIRARLTVSGTTIRAYVVSNTIGGQWEFISASGQIQPNNTAVMYMVGYAPDRDGLVEPKTGRFTAELDSGDCLVGDFETDVPTHGFFKLRRADRLETLILSVPPFLTRFGLLLARITRKHFRWVFLLLICVLTILPLLHLLPERIGVVEAVVLGTVALFLYSDKVARVVADLRLRRAGMFEFQDQRNKGLVDPAALDAQLRNEFGDDAPLMQGLSNVLAGRTRVTLRVLLSKNRAFSEEELEETARALGVPRANIDSTLNALKQTKMILPHAGGWAVSDLGAQLIRYEDRVREIFAQSA